MGTKIIEFEWRSRAACLGGTDWFPGVNKQGARDREAVRRAIETCVTRCPVRPECADLAVKLEVPTGIWAGIDLGDTWKALPKAKREQLESIARGSM